MNTGESQPSSLQIGSLVRVKEGVTDIAYEDIVLDSWTGTVTEMDDDMCCVQWSVETLDAMPQEYCDRWRGAGLSTDSLWLPQESTEIIAPSGNNVTPGGDKATP